MVSMQRQMADDNRKLRKQLDNAKDVIVDMRIETAETNEKMRRLTKWFGLD